MPSAAGHFRFMMKMKHKPCKEEFEDTKGVIIIRKSNKNRQHNDKKGQSYMEHSKQF